MEKNVALFKWTLFGKVISVLFNMLSRFVIAFLERNKSYYGQEFKMFSPNKIDEQPEPTVWHRFSSVQLHSRVRLFANPWTAAQQASLSITNSWSLLKLMSIESVMPPNHLILCHPLSSCLQSSPASGSFLMSQLFT